MYLKLPYPGRTHKKIPRKWEQIIHIVNVTSVENNIDIVFQLSPVLEFLLSFLFFFRLPGRSSGFLASGVTLWWGGCLRASHIRSGVLSASTPGLYRPGNCRTSGRFSRIISSLPRQLEAFLRRPRRHHKGGGGLKISSICFLALNRNLGIVTRFTPRRFNTLFFFRVFVESLM